MMTCCTVNLKFSPFDINDSENSVLLCRQVSNFWLRHDDLGDNLAVMCDLLLIATYMCFKLFFLAWKH